MLFKDDKHSSSPVAAITVMRRYLCINKREMRARIDNIKLLASNSNPPGRPQYEVDRNRHTISRDRPSIRIK